MDDKTNEIRKDSVALSEYLHRFQRNEMASIVDRLCEGCMVPRYTMYNWIRGLARIPQLHKCKIEEILDCKVFDSLEKCEK
jgi:hypothetical protein